LKSDNYALLSPQSTFGDSEGMASSDSAAKPNLDDAKETIQFQFGLEILLKHEELRLIDQELAKCQIALEQLRRCHLIPYPVSCPTPDQMLQISSGKGAALQTRPGEAVPRWAPPFGVVDGPYSRHYAKWLIPDPAFGDVVPQPQRLAEGTRSKNATAEGRATRNSITDYSMLSKARPGRASAGQKLQALSSGYTQPKDKAGPCLVKKSDGETVKLVCVDCKRWDFSSTQGFINHCRIAHKKEYKSHEEAAIHAGRPIELDEAGSIVGNEMPPAPAAPAPSGLVHPFARSEFITDQQGYARLFSRLNESVKLYKEGKLPHVNSIPVSGRAKEGAPQAPPAFSGAPTTPYLSQLLQKTNFSGDLGEHVEDAKTKTVTEDVYAAGDDSEDSDHPMGMDGASSPIKAVGATAARASGVMRMPARTLVSAVPLPTLPRPGSSKSNVSPGGLSAPRLSSLPEKDEALNLYDAVDMHLSPSTVTGHNAPSLVSDDGEYDDSDDGSSSDTSDGLDTESVSDVAEINIDEDTDETPRPVLHHRTNSATTVKLRKDEAKHVTFVTPIPGNGKAITANTKQRRKQNV
jgi:ADA HAT complex component 1